MTPAAASRLCRIESERSMSSFAAIGALRSERDRLESQGLGTDAGPHCCGVTRSNAADMAAVSGRGMPLARPAVREVAATVATKLIRWSLWPAVFCRGKLAVNALSARLDYFTDMSDSLERLYLAVIAAKDLDPAVSRTARLFRRGHAKMAKKLAEEAVEVVIDAVSGNTDAVISESADLLYNLTVLWAAAGVRPEDVWREMERREHLLGIAEKLPKSPVKLAKVPARLSRRPIVALESRSLRKRH
jgi:phosphoribosyl-ATP pyrophosphohydrolase